MKSLDVLRGIQSDPLKMDRCILNEPQMVQRLLVDAVIELADCIGAHQGQVDLSEPTVEEMPALDLSRVGDGRKVKATVTLESDRDSPDRDT